MEGTATDDDKPSDVQGFLALARKRFDRVSKAEAEIRVAALDDLKFKAGDQWPAQIKAQREREMRPCLTINKMKTFVHQITNDQRQNRPTINVSPVGDKGDPEVAKMLRGMIRHIERQSDADIAYDTAFDNAVSNGWGYWRVITEFEGDDTFDQTIRVRRIRNPFTVYLDPDCQQPDGSDAKWGFVTEKIERAEFSDLYPKADPCSWETLSIGDDTRDWGSDTHIRIAEYFVVESEGRKLVQLTNGHIGYESDLDQSVKDQITADPSMVFDSREVECKQIRWYMITAREILKQEDWQGDWIPIIKVVGDEIDIEGKVHLAGIIRDGKDPQRQKNYLSTTKTELLALAPKSPWVIAEGQDEGHEAEWNNANNTMVSRLIYKPTSAGGSLVPPPQRQVFAGPPTGVIEAERDSEQDMMGTMGVRFDATKSERLHDESGVALQHLRQNTDLGAFHYPDNLGRSLKHSARIYINLIPRIYRTKQIRTILREDGSDERVQIDPSQTVAYLDVQQDGKKVKSFNPKIGDYEVTATIGPSYATKRIEAATQMVQFAQVVEKAPMIADLIAEMQDWPGAEKVVERLQRMLPHNLLEPEQKDMTPQTQAFISSLKQQLDQAHQQLQQATVALNDKSADHALEALKITSDFEAKLQAVAAQMEIKMLDHVGARMDEISTHVHSMEQQNLAHQQAMTMQANAPAPSATQ